MNPRVELRWYFDEAPGELGLRAQSYQPRGNNPPPEAAAERQALAAARYADVERRLEPLATEQRRVLRLAFESHPWPKLERWYELAGVAAWLVDRQDVDGAAKRVALVRGKDEEILRALAKAKLEDALAAFQRRPAPPPPDVPRAPHVPRVKRPRRSVVVPAPSRVACTCLDQWDDGALEQLDLPRGASPEIYRAVRESLPGPLRPRLSAAVESTDGRLHFRAGRACSNCWRRDNLPWG